jgi:anti-anti-sigma factor
MVMSFIADVSQIEGRVVLRLTGELDIATADDMLAAGRRALEDARHGPLFLDLSELSFCDSTGMRSLLRLNHEALRCGRTVVLRNVQPNVRRVMEIAGFDTVLRLDVGPLSA